MEPVAQQAAPGLTHGFSADAVWVMVGLGLAAALLILWLVDWLGGRKTPRK